MRWLGDLGCSIVLFKTLTRTLSRTQLPRTCSIKEARTETKIAAHQAFEPHKPQEIHKSLHAKFKMKNIATPAYFHTLSLPQTQSLFSSEAL